MKTSVQSLEPAKTLQPLSAISEAVFSIVKESAKDCHPFAALLEKRSDFGLMPSPVQSVPVAVEPEEPILV